MAKFEGNIRSQFKGICKQCHNYFMVGEWIHLEKDIEGATHQQCYDKNKPKIITKIVNRVVTQATDAKKDGEIAKLKRRVKELENEILFLKDDNINLQKRMQNER